MVGGALMAIRFILTDYVNQALAHAIYDKVEDGLNEQKGGKR